MQPVSLAWTWEGRGARQMPSSFCFDPLFMHVAAAVMNTHIA
jgi:hypothetical protein